MESELRQEVDLKSTAEQLSTEVQQSFARETQRADDLKVNLYTEYIHTNQVVDLRGQYSM